MKNKLRRFFHKIFLFFVTLFGSVKNFFALKTCKDNFNSSFNVPPSINISKHHFEDSDDEISLPNSRNTSKVSNKSNFGEDDESNVTPTTNNNTHFLRISPLPPMVNSTPLNESTHKKLKRNCFDNMPDISPTNPNSRNSSSVNDLTSPDIRKKLKFDDQEE